MEEFASFNRRVAHAKVLSTKDIPMGWISGYIYFYLFILLPYLGKPPKKTSWVWVSKLQKSSHTINILWGIYALQNWYGK
jgi:hypothetical protein